MTDPPGLIRATPAFTTGGGGFEFEDLVAAWLGAAMLAGRSPIGEGVGIPSRIGRQESSLRMPLDDLGVAGPGGEPVWHASVKSFDMLTGGRLQAEFAAAAWAQIAHPAFERDRDWVGFVCGEAAEGNWRALDELVAVVRADDPERLAARIGPGAFNDTHRSLWESARCPEALAAEIDVGVESSSALLLARLVPLRLDLLSADSASAADAKRWCAEALAPGHAADAADLWDALCRLVAQVNPLGGSLDWPLVLRRLSRFAFRARPDAEPDWELLRGHTASRLGGVRSDLAGGLELPRSDAWSAIEAIDAEQGLVFVTGGSGCGKTALARRWLEAATGDVLWLSAYDLRDDLAGFVARKRLRLELAAVLALGAPPLRVVVDGLDRAFDEPPFAATAALARQALASGGLMQVMVTSQSFALDRVSASLRANNGPDAATPVVLGDLDDSDVERVLTTFPALRRLAVQGELGGALRRPKLLDVVIASLARSGEEAVTGRTDEAGVADLWWRQLALGGGPDRASRGELLLGLARIQGDTFTYTIRSGELGELAAFIDSVDGLRRDGVLSPDEDQYAFEHELFGDWSRFRAFGAWPAAAEDIRARAEFPPWHRAIRLYALRILQQDGAAAWLDAVALLAQPVHGIAADLFLDAPLLADGAGARLEELWPRLVEEGSPLLGRMLGRFLHVATAPDPRGALVAEGLAPDLALQFAATWRVPLWPLWPPILAVLHAHRADAVDAAPIQIGRIVDTWLRSTPGGTVLRSEAAELGLELGDYVAAARSRSTYFDDEHEVAMFRAFVAAGAELPGEVAERIAVAFADDDPDADL